MKVYFARHGQTDWNILAKVQGTTDIPLNENGILQAQNLCEYLKEKGISFEKIYTSYQLRARQTAQIVDEQFHTGYEIVKGLEEMNLGMFEGHAIAGNRADYEEKWKTNLEVGDELLRHKTRQIMDAARKGTIGEFNAKLMIMVMDTITVYESGNLKIRFYDGTEFSYEAV